MAGSSETSRFGLVGNFKAQPEQGEALAELLLQAAEVLTNNPDCELYLISRDSADADLVWVTEIWTSREAHAASLHNERVRELVVRAGSLIADAAQRYELRPLGGKGLAPSTQTGS